MDRRAGTFSDQRRRLRSADRTTNPTEIRADWLFPYGVGLLVWVSREGEVYVTAENGELSIRPFSPNGFGAYGGVASDSGIVFSESLDVYPYRTVLSVPAKDLIESE